MISQPSVISKQPQKVVPSTSLSRLSVPRTGVITLSTLAASHAAVTESSQPPSPYPLLKEFPSSSLQAADVAYGGFFFTLAAIGVAMAAAVAQFKPLAYQDKLKMNSARKVFSVASAAGVFTGAAATIAGLVGEGIPHQFLVLSCVFTALSGAFVCVSKLGAQES